MHTNNVCAKMKIRKRIFYKQLRMVEDSKCCGQGDFLLRRVQEVPYHGNHEFEDCQEILEQNVLSSVRKVGLNRR